MKLYPFIRTRIWMSKSGKMFKAVYHIRARDWADANGKFSRLCKAAVESNKNKYWKVIDAGYKFT